MYCKSLHTLKQHTNVDQCGIVNKVLEHKVVRQTTMETRGFVFQVQIHYHESYVSVEELVGCKSLSTRSLELGLFQPLSRFHYFDPFHQGRYLKNLLCRNKKKLLSLKNLLRSGRGVKQQRKRCWRPTNCMRTWRSDMKRTISSFRKSCRRALLVSLLSPDPVITSGACGFRTILVVRWTIFCVVINYISVVCSGVMNYMSL